MKHVISSVLLTCAALALASPAAMAAELPAGYPSKPIRFIVPFPPGAANDTLARTVGQNLAERWGKPVIIDNRGGAGGMLGMGIAAAAVPDGYTIVIVPATHAINVSLYKKPPFDAVKDFAPISLIATGAYMLSVNPSLPARSVKELIALAKARPGKLNFGSAGTGNATHLLGELLKSKAGIEITHVPYKGVGPALAAVIGGQLDMVFGSISGTAPHAKSGRVRPLAITSMKRSPAVPDVPTLHEAGVPGFDAVGWWGVLAPAGTSPAIVNKMNAEISAIVNEPKTRQWLERQGFEAAAGSAAEFGRFIKSEIAKWGEIVKTSGAQLD